MSDLTGNPEGQVSRVASQFKCKSLNVISTCSEGAWHSTNKDGLSGVQGLRSIHNKVRITQVPRSDLNLQEKVTLFINS